jgi:hypothetical protein
LNTSTAGNASIKNGYVTQFLDSSTAGKASIANNSIDFRGPAPGVMMLVREVGSVAHQPAGCDVQFESTRRWLGQRVRLRG